MWHGEIKRKDLLRSVTSLEDARTQTDACVLELLSLARVTWNCSALQDILLNEPPSDISSGVWPMSINLN